MDDAKSKMILKWMEQVRRSELSIADFFNEYNVLYKQCV